MHVRSLGDGGTRRSRRARWYPPMGPDSITQPDQGPEEPDEKRVRSLWCVETRRIPTAPLYGPVVSSPSSLDLRHLRLTRPPGQGPGSSSTIVPQQSGLQCPAVPCSRRADPTGDQIVAGTAGEGRPGSPTAPLALRRVGRVSTPSSLDHRRSRKLMVGSSMPFPIHAEARRSQCPRWRSATGPDSTHPAPSTPEGPDNVHVGPLWRCGDEENRTPNPRLAKAVLCQLSYVPWTGNPPGGVATSEQVRCGRWPRPRALPQRLPASSAS